MPKATFIAGTPAAVKAAVPLVFLLACTAGVHAQHMDHAAHAGAGHPTERQAEVARRGNDVMPFSLPATEHIFTPTADGGVQQVVARNPTDAAQVKLVREHLRTIREDFSKGDFSGPAHIHGQDMPGLAELAAAKPGQIEIVYKDIRGGAQLTYSTPDPSLAMALHKWFAAQLSDHGKDAMAGHAHPGGRAPRSKLP